MEQERQHQSEEEEEEEEEEEGGGGGGGSEVESERDVAVEEEEGEEQIELVFRAEAIANKDGSDARADGNTRLDEASELCRLDIASSPDEVISSAPISSSTSPGTVAVVAHANGQEHGRQAIDVIDSPPGRAHPNYTSYRNSASDSPSSASSFSPSRFEGSPTVSPDHRRLTITPRQGKYARTRLSTSITPTAQPHLSGPHEIISLVGDSDDSDDSDEPPRTERYEEPVYEEWGDDAVLQWDGSGLAENVDGDADADLGGDSASSVAPGDAGLDPDEVEEEQEDWGREAYLVYNDWEADADDGRVAGNDAAIPVESDGIGSGQDSEVEERIEEPRPSRRDIQSATGGSGRRQGLSRQTPVMESLDQLRLRGMPDYAGWDLKRLQRLCEGFGYRPSTNHAALEKIAADCWKALNPLDYHTAAAESPETDRRAVRGFKTSTSTKAKAGKAARRDSSSSLDIPLAERKNSEGSSNQSKRKYVHGPSGQASSRSRAPGKEATTIDVKGKGRAVSVADSDTDIIADSEVPLDKRFFEMIRGDDELYLRILQYEPIAFDELVSKAIRIGIKDKGWKIRLKKYLDFQGITFYTEEPTGQRRRH